MAGSIYTWSTTAGSNANADGDINFNEGQAPSTLNNSSRQVMGRVAEFVKDLGGTISATGTANAILVSANSQFTSYATGQILTFKAASTNTAAATLSVNSIGAKSIRTFTSLGEEALTAGAIQANGIYEVNYQAAANGGAGGWILTNPSSPVSSQGTWAPTMTGVVNVGGTASAAGHYMRTGARVVCFGQFALSATSSSSTVVGISLPIASAFTATNQLSGVSNSAPQGPGVIYADATNDRAEVQFVANAAGSVFHTFMFGYQIL